MEDKQDFTSQVDAIFEELKAALGPDNNSRERVLDEMAVHCMSLALMAGSDDDRDAMHLFFGAILLLGRTAMGNVQEPISKNDVFKRGATEIAERMYRDDPEFKKLVHRLIEEFE